ncbi:hypothetical protein [Amycolatopsis mediterranei]|uniref:Uncharacterized protein n=1 Tax=Amycolatopsis mediterranei (strain S699) TaxID=713604 RepID=A0A9R0P2X1_AMYMS|nr:hypothetical protein [Amycolatopsis mediterranei]AEK45201.1 hypothetical protein RAM_33640 [Amycolatopsis mediterranei S699]
MDVKQIESVPEDAPRPVGTTEAVIEDGAAELEPTIVLGRE